MSISIRTAAEWFHHIRGTPAEHRAALYRLIRMLCGDDRRPRPPVSLPGRMPAAALAPTPPTPPVRYFRRAPPAGKMANAPSTDADGRDPYSRKQLDRMDRRFAQRLELAIARKQERPPCSTS
jgi:hypothetical protein